MQPDGERPWTALSTGARSVFEKMQAVGTPLKNWDISIYRGILTGYNEAFIVDTAVRDRLIGEDPSSEQILKPVLRGRDIARYRANWADLWLIDTHNGYADIPAVDVEDYPAVKAHLDRFLEPLRRRRDKGATPYNLRNCAYHETFEHEKLFWIDLAEEGRFSYEPDLIYCTNSVYMISGQNIEYLCAVLNSSLITWFMKTTAATSGMGVTRWFKIYVENIPIPKPSIVDRLELTNLMNKILDIKSSTTPAHTEYEESEIDHIVCSMYGLTTREVALVTNRSSDPS